MQAQNHNLHTEASPEPMRRPDQRAKRWSRPKHRKYERRSDGREAMLNWLQSNA